MRPTLFMFFVLMTSVVLVISSSSDENQGDIDGTKEDVKSKIVPQSSLDELNEKQQSRISVESKGDVLVDQNTEFSKQRLFHNHLEQDKHNHQVLQSEINLNSEVDASNIDKEITLTEDTPNLNNDEILDEKNIASDESQSMDNSEDRNEVDVGIKDTKEGSDFVANPPDSVSKDVQDKEKDQKESQKKQRYFPLLYTFGSLFTSFLAEFGEVSSSSDTSTSLNSSQSVVKNSSAVDGLLQHLNATSNSTDQGKRTRFQCSLHKNVTIENFNETAKVSIINSTELLEMLNFSKNQKSSPCVLVMFYTKWCHFSARAAPEYNALARAFPQLDVLAVDTSHFSYLNAKFGTVAVPNIMLFHSRSAVRFNHTTRDLDNFIQFVSNNTGLEPSLSVAVLPEDFEGPLSSQVVQGCDWLLWLSWAFILVCSIYGFFFSLYGQAIIARLRVLWQEHQHIE